MNGNQWRTWAAAAIIGLFSGGGTALTLGQTGALRPNPFTSLDGRELRLELEGKIAEERAARQKLEERVRALERRVSHQRKTPIRH